MKPPKTEIIKYNILNVLQFQIKGRANKNLAADFNRHRKQERKWNDQLFHSVNDNDNQNYN